jgi:7-keto-8-aminopelargonate synthetase-like enzyme
MNLGVKPELLKELALEAAIPTPDIGIRAGLDSWHPVYRGRPVTSFASWDLLGLHNRRDVQGAMAKVLSESGCGVASARLAGGLSASHLQCEQRLAQFFGGESATLFNNKNQAVLSVVTALCGEGAVVLGPSLGALPLADACALAHAEYGEYETVEQLRSLLERYGGFRRVLVVVESVSPLTGDGAEITQINRVVEQFGAWLLIDESAALGLGGMRGAGSSEVLPSSPALLCRVCNFLTLVGSEVSGVVGSLELKELVLRRSRYLRFDPPPLPASAQAIEVALGAAELSIVGRRMLAARAQRVQQVLKAQGWKIGLSDEGIPILSVAFDTLQVARSIQEALLQRALYVDALAARGLRRNGAVVRVLLSLGHSEGEVQSLLEGFAEVQKRFVQPQAKIE